MKVELVVPSWLLGFVAAEERFLSICPQGEPAGGVVERIRRLTAADLSNGHKVVSSQCLELVRGGLFYGVAALTPAHQIFQEDSTGLGSYWHGMLHRREGDFSNACYWFRQAGAISALGDLPGFDPVSFTMSCARAKGVLPEHIILQRQEWDVLMLHCLRKALGSAAL